MKRPRLVPEWRFILRHAWSIRLILLAGILTGVESVLPFIAPGAVPDAVLSGLTLAVVASAFVARLLAQRSMGDREGDDDA